MVLPRNVVWPTAAAFGLTMEAPGKGSLKVADGREVVVGAGRQSVSWLKPS